MSVLDTICGYPYTKQHRMTKLYSYIDGVCGVCMWVEYLNFECDSIVKYMALAKNADTRY